MINKTAIALAENIAIGIPTGVVVQGSDIIQALNAESFGAFEYNEHFREQIPEVTADTQHGPMLTLTAERLAETVRGSFEMVKTYGVPVAQAIGKGLGLIYSAGALRDLALRKFTVVFSNIDDPFFDSAIYPTEGLIKNKALSFSSVGLDSLKRLEWEYPDATTVREFMASQHPEIIDVLNSKEASLDMAAWSLQSLDSLRGFFEFSGESTFDFTRIKSVNVNVLLKMWLLLSKMYGEERTVPWLSNGSREDYRNYVELMWNGLTTYLVQLKKVVQSYKARKVVLVTNKPVRLVDYTPPNVDASLKILEGEVTLYYTREAMALAEQQHNSLLECVVASAYSTIVGQGKGLLDLVGSKQLTTEVTSAYYGSVHNTMDAKARGVFIENALESITKFINEREAAKLALYENTGDNNSSVYTLVRNALLDDVDKLYFLYSAASKDDDGTVSIDGDGEREARCTDIVLKTDLVPKFLRLLGCVLAAEVIELTFVRQEVEDNLNDKRERLHGALIELLVSKLLV